MARAGLSRPVRRVLRTLLLGPEVGLTGGAKLLVGLARLAPRADVTTDAAGATTTVDTAVTAGNTVGRPMGGTVGERRMPCTAVGGAPAGALRVLTGTSTTAGLRDTAVGEVKWTELVPVRGA